MNNKASITALMSSFGRAFHAENEKNPMTAEELQKFFPEKEHRIRMYDAMEELKVSYQALVDQKADEKITKYIRL